MAMDSAAGASLLIIITITIIIFIITIIIIIITIRQLTDAIHPSIRPSMDGRPGWSGSGSAPPRGPPRSVPYITIIVD